MNYPDSVLFRKMDASYAVRIHDDKAGEEDRTPDIQLGNGRAVNPKSLDSQELREGATSVCTRVCTKYRRTHSSSLDNLDPELAAVAVAWHGLPAAVRAGIAAMVRASTIPPEVGVGL